MNTQHTGETVACPGCAHTLAKNIAFDGNGSMDMKCPHCNGYFTITFNQKQVITAIKIIKNIVLIAVFGAGIAIALKPGLVDVAVQKIHQYASRTN